MLCTILAALLTIVMTAYVSPVQAESSGGFQPRLDPDTSCEITVIGSYSNFEALEAEFDSFNEFYPDVELNYLKPEATLLTVPLWSSRSIKPVRTWT